MENKAVYLKIWIVVHETNAFQSEGIGVTVTGQESCCLSPKGQYFKYLCLWNSHEQLKLQSKNSIL